MAHGETKVSYNGIGIFGLLGVVFVTLKLTGYIDWSWWWVTAPFWGGIGLWLFMLFLAFCFEVASHRRRISRRFLG